MNILRLLCIGLILASGIARAEEFTYVNYAPDVRYSANGQDSRIVILPDEGLYGFGHDFGKSVACAELEADCIAMDYMAFLKIPMNAKVGSRFIRGNFSFEVVAEQDLIVLGKSYPVYRVDVSREGVAAVTYLHHPEHGILAIIARNFDNDKIPTSIFLLAGATGLFGARPISH